MDFAHAAVALSDQTTMVDGYARPVVTVNEMAQPGRRSGRPSLLMFSRFRKRSCGSDMQEPGTGEAAASPKTIFRRTSWGVKRSAVPVPVAVLEDVIVDENQDSLVESPPSPASDGPERRISLLRRCSDWFLKRDRGQVLEGVEGLEWTCECSDRLVTDVSAPKL